MGQATLETSTTTAAASTARSLSDFRPLSSSSSIVITSHSREVVERLQVFSDEILDVEPTEVDMAKTLLLKKPKKAGQDVNSDDMVRLVKHLDCMPLAVTQAAAYIEQAVPRLTLRRYMKMLVKDDSILAKLLQRNVRGPRQDQQASNSIIMTG
jgi:hypothetical protein